MALVRPFLPRFITVVFVRRVKLLATSFQLPALRRRSELSAGRGSLTALFRPKHPQLTAQPWATGCTRTYRAVTSGIVRRTGVSRGSTRAEM